MEKIIIRSPATFKGSTKEHVEFEIESLEQASDGFHTVQELYRHRNALFIAYCELSNGCLETIKEKTGPNPSLESRMRPWRSRTHSDGKAVFQGYFILGIEKEPGRQITYHIPIEEWNETDFAETLQRAPVWDDHTPDEVLQRLRFRLEDIGREE